MRGRLCGTTVRTLVEGPRTLVDARGRVHRGPHDEVRRVAAPPPAVRIEQLVGGLSRRAAPQLLQLVVGGPRREDEAVGQAARALAAGGWSGGRRPPNGLYGCAGKPRI